MKCSEMWPGNTADVTTVIPVVDRLRRRFDIGRVCIVADRGMISAETLTELGRAASSISWACGAYRQAGARTRARRSGAVRATHAEEAR